MGEQLDERKALFKEIDCNGNYYISLAEIQSCFSNKLDYGPHAPEVVDCHLLHAYDKARNYGGDETGAKADFIEHREFRVFMEIFVHKMDGTEKTDFGELDDNWKPA